MGELHVVTGAFGYSGKYIARGLLERGHTVRTLTNSPNRPSAITGHVEVEPLAFDEPDKLAKSLEGAKVLYNTYWVRFDHKTFTHDAAVKNTLILFDAARLAGVSRIVHVSITNPSPSSPLPYFSGKAKLERSLQQLQIPYSILRPAVLFGDVDILINNIVWALRRFPVFGVFGTGNYGICPIHVEDLARLAVEAGAHEGCETVDAIGPEFFRFRDLIRELGAIVGCKRPIVSVPKWFGYVVARCVGFYHRDVFLTWEEVLGLTSGLLASQSTPTGTIRLTEWAKEHANDLGRTYASEMRRRRLRDVPYAVFAPP